MEKSFAKVIIDISHEKVDRPFEYKIPASLMGKLAPGMCVNVPFGNGNKLRKAYILELEEIPEFPAPKLKEIASLAEGQNGVEEQLIALAAWIKRTYGSTMIQALKTVLPAKQKISEKKKKTILRLISRDEAVALQAQYIRKHQTAKARVLEELTEQECLPYELVTEKLHVGKATLQSLEKELVLKVVSEDVYRDPVGTLQAKKCEEKVLSDEQKRIISTVLEEYDNGSPGCYLIHGITGSGKTEVYIRLIEQMCRRGRQTIVLIPEIALTYQTLMRFYQHFGNRVSVLNSTLSAGEKYDQIKRARDGDIDIIIGPRSALFTPFPKLGLIIMDEEHESSYKSDAVPRFHARETAQELARMCGASLVLGSATPSLEAYYRAQNGDYRLFELNRRLTGGSLPTVHVVDLRKELKEGNRSVFSRKLQELMEDRLTRGEQIMLFLNRRGYAGFISCRACGLVLKCPHCDVSLSEHKDGKLRCHYCGYEQSMVSKCPECGSPYIMGFKAGTQQIEEQIKIRYPKARVLRMDADTTSTKDSYEEILAAFSEEKADILLGTQMIVKGHDFPKVTLVGVLAADLSLFASDYRAGERTFQLLTQAAGRAGRGKLPGEVVIQTYQPEHYSIAHAAKQDYKGFYEEELLYRELMSYPPVSHMMAFLLQMSNEKKGKIYIEQIASLVKNRFYGHNIVTIGPSSAMIGKINDVYRFVFYIKCGQSEELEKIRECIEQYMEENEMEDCNTSFDFDPCHIY